MREQAEPCAVDDPKFYALMAGRGVQGRNGLAAGGRWIRTIGPPPTDLRLSRKSARLLARDRGVGADVSVQPGFGIIMPSPLEAFVPFTRAKASFLSCFWHKVLYDIGIVSTKEPFRNLFNQGMILAFSYRDAAGRYYEPEKVMDRHGLGARPA